MPPKSKTPNSSAATTPAASQDINTAIVSSSQDNDKSTSVCRCSANCNFKIKTTYDANIHPLLGVILCRDCYFNYGDGDFSKFPEGVDDNGDDNYCRWCGDGGDLFGCHSQDENGYSCHYVFCRDCVKRNVPNDPVLEHGAGEGYEWICYVCEPSRLDSHREKAAEVMKSLMAAEFSDVETVIDVDGVANGTLDTEATDISQSKESEEAKESETDHTGPMETEDAQSDHVTQSEKITDGKEITGGKETQVGEEAVKVNMVEKVKEAMEAKDDVAEAQDVVEANEVVKAIEVVEDKEAVEDKEVLVANGEVEVIEDKGIQQGDEDAEANECAMDLDKECTLDEDKDHNMEEVTQSAVVLKRSDLDQRITHFSGIKESCIDEITTKLDRILKAFKSKHFDQKLNSIISMEIESIRGPMSDLNDMLNDLQNLSRSFPQVAVE